MHRRGFITTAASILALPSRVPPVIPERESGELAANTAVLMHALPSFVPSTHGFPFANFSSDGLLDLGNCGGMSWSALDRFINRHSARVSLTNALRTEIEHRQRDTLDDWLWAKVGEWQLKPNDDSGPLQPHSLKYSSREEWPQIKKSLDGGIPINLILILADKMENPGHNHQVLAYEYSTSGNVVTMGIYDSNQPDKDDVKIRFTTSGSELKARFLNSSVSYNHPRGFMAVEYDRTLNVHVHRLTAAGTVGSRVDHRAWSRGWTSAEFHHSGGQVGLLLLKQGNGKLHAHVLDAGGVVGNLAEAKDWSSGWTSLTTYEVGGVTYMMMLKDHGTGSDGNNAHIYRIEADGSIGPKLYEYDWSEGWTHVVPFEVNTQPFLFLMKKGSGVIHVHKLNDNGSVGTRVDTRDWSGGWSTITSYEAGGNTYLLLLKTIGAAADGNNVHIHRMNADGRIGQKVHAYSWTAGWSSATPYLAGGQPYLVILKEVGGRARIYKVTSTGGIGTRTDDRDWTSGWSSVKVFEQNGTNYLFLLKDGQLYDAGWWLDLIEGAVPSP